MECRWSWGWSGLEHMRYIHTNTSLNQRHLAMVGPAFFKMKIIDWKWLVVPIGADVPEHCAHVSALLCLLHPPNWTQLLQWDRTRQSRDFEMRRRHVKTSVGKTTELPELQSSFEACWNLWCLFCVVRRFFLSWMFHTVLKVFMDSYLLRMLTRLHLKKRAFCCDFMCTLSWYRRKGSGGN